MKCPYCGEEMKHGELTGSKLLRLAPEQKEPTGCYRYNSSLPASQFDVGLDGIFLDVPYSGVAFRVPADYCRGCKKVIFDAGILHEREVQP